MTSQDPQVGRGVELGERRQRAGAQRAGVVDQGRGAAQLGRDVDQVAPVRRVGDVAGDGRVRAAGQPRTASAQGGLVPGVEDQGPAAARQLVGEREAEPLGGTR